MKTPAQTNARRHGWARRIRGIASQLQRRAVGGLLGGAVLAACAGCQTFSLTEEDFQKQQFGGMADRRTGAVVGAAATAAELGAAIGLAAAEAAGK